MYVNVWQYDVSFEEKDRTMVAQTYSSILGSDISSLNWWGELIPRLFFWKLILFWRFDPNCPQIFYILQKLSSKFQTFSLYSARHNSQGSQSADYWASKDESAVRFKCQKRWCIMATKRHIFIGNFKSIVFFEFWIKT